MNGFRQHVRHTVWNGNQELAEIRPPDDTTDAAIEEMDTGGIRRGNMIRKEMQRPRRTYWSLDDYR